MGQYYKVVILADTKYKTEIVRKWMLPNSCAKLMEHAYLDNPFMRSIEAMLGRDGVLYMTRIIWVGDYAENEENLESNLYYLVENMSDRYYRLQQQQQQPQHQYIVNHTKKLYVDKNKCTSVHPLPLLVSEGNGCGGGDYFGNDQDLCGTWARDVISMEQDIPEEYTELTVSFS